VAGGLAVAFGAAARTVKCKGSPVKGAGIGSAAVLAVSVPNAIHARSAGLNLRFAAS
jgi:hypothetical protein